MTPFSELDEKEIERIAGQSCIAMKLEYQLTDEDENPGVRVVNAAFSPTSPMGWETTASAWAYRRNLWGHRQMLRVRYINGDSRQRSMMDGVLKRVDEWCGLGIRVVKSGPSEARIGFDLGAGHWSYVGTDNEKIPQHQKTMNIGLRGNVDEDERDRVCIHEIFHFLGLGHEHQHPNARIPWNRPNVYRVYGRTQGWSRSQIDQQVMNRSSSVGFVGTSEADKDSIMMYPIDKALVLDTAFAVGWNTKVSESDLATLRSFYP